MAGGEIAELQETAGLTNDEMEYLRAKGLTLTKHLARCATSDEAFEKKVTQPFLEGIDIAGEMHKAGRDSEHVTAVMLVAFEEASKRRKAELKGTTDSAGAPGTAPSIPELRCPKVLQTGAWQRGIDRWQGQWEPPRKFPQKQLIGTEEVLARMLFERNNSRIYYPIFLNELLDLRAYHSDGSINEDRARKPKNQVQVSMAGQEAIFSNIEEIDEAPISSSWVVMDALEAGHTVGRNTVQT